VPSQQQVRWSELRVGITVIIASIALAVLIFLMSGSTGIFTRNLHVRSYFNNAGGLREGSPVRLQGVDVGNVSKVHVVADPKRQLTPVELTLKIHPKFRPELHKDSQVTISTEGVIGGSYVDIDSTQAKGPPIDDGDELPTKEKPDLMGMVSAGQSTLQNIQTLVQRMDRIVSTIENGQGSVGKFINDPELYNRLNATLAEVQGIVNTVSSGKGSIGQLIYSDEMYQKMNGTVDKLNNIIDQVNSGQGSVGKFLKDPSLYDNANETIAKANKLVDDINSGKGAIGKLTKDEEFAKKLDNTMSKVSLLADRLEAGEGAVGKLLKDPAVYNNLDQMLVETRTLVKAIRENPKKYLTIHFRVF
jgi:phospholipid/cholesterol/gamma-HCH transport system substrate-binding protein